MLLQFLAQDALLEIIGEQILHAAKAGSLGRSKPVEEWHFVEEHGQIGSKFRHDRMSSRVRLMVPYRSGLICLWTGSSLPRDAACGVGGVSSIGRSRIS